MVESNRWGLPRYATLLVVLALHVALLALLAMNSRIRNVSASTADPVELLFISPASLPRIRSENSRPKRMSSDAALSVAPPVIDSPGASPSPSASGSDDSESGVNWAAEARRALKAFDIRNHQAARSLSSAPAEDNWWPRAHHAGEQLKTANGDWIVWINSKCYQVASSVPPTYMAGATLPQTICPGEPGTARAALPSQSPARN